MRVAIAGYGVEGKASYEYWRARGDEVVIADERTELIDVPAGIETILGSDAFARLDDFDMIVRSPSIRLDKLPYGGKVWSATNEFFAKCPAPIIGVTGTKGKGTTCSLITSILRAVGKTVHLVGNIGQPALAVSPTIQPSDIVVYELSSFQLWDLQRSPHVAVVLGIEPDHLDVHADFEEYVSAKAKIVAYQQPGDVVVYNQKNEYSTAIAKRHSGLDPESRQIIPYPFDISDVADSLQITGAHNRENASAAIAAVREYTTDPEIIRQGLASFTGLSHRLKFVAEKNSVKYYDDNYSSAPAATLAAIQAFDAPEVLIAGGYDRGTDFSELAVHLAERNNLAHVVLIGQTGLRLRDALEAHGFLDVTLIEGSPNMQQIVHEAREQAVPGGVVIMSPGCPSFDMFQNFTNRGEQFIAAVEAL